MGNEFKVTLRDLIPLVQCRMEYRNLDTLGLYERGTHLTSKFFDGCQELFENQGEMDFAFGFALGSLIDSIIRFNPNCQPYEVAMMAHDIVMHVPEV